MGQRPSRHQILISALILAGGFLAPGLALALGSAPSGKQLAAEGQKLYDEGKFGEALLKFEQAIKAGAEGGDLFYQTGYCLKVVRQDQESSRQYMTRAAPLLEKALEGKGASPAPYYYLAAIYTVELADWERGSAVAKRGVAQVEGGAFKKATDGASLFQIARLYTIAGDKDKAIAWYERSAAAFDSAKAPNREYRVAALLQLATYYNGKQDFARASEWFGRLLAVDPGRDAERITAGMAMTKAERYAEAAAILRTGFLTDEMATEANYLVRVLDRYIALQGPAVPEEVRKLDEAGLSQAIDKAAATLGGIRQKDEEEFQKSIPPPEEPKTVWKATKSGQRIQVKVPPPEPAPVTPPPPSAERQAAEKEFFGLLLEYVRRGHLIREFCLGKGLAALIFR
ncbi:MAG TPA: tetratricopeptide repeat protein [Candidatus Polarisedimenticolia bacterium]|jgi:tetratricopeptide (TPR) repeat protein